MQNLISYNIDYDDFYRRNNSKCVFAKNTNF